jgi:thiosulfate reductase/polysulfide reductase chain A
MKTTRRQFIKISGMTAAGAAVAGSVLGSIGKAAEKSGIGQVSPDSKLTRTPTYCEVCFWKCAAWVYKDDEGNIKKLIGNEADQHARGKLCPRGTGGLGMYYDENRLKKPLIRRNRDDDKFEEVEWDEAFEFIAKKMNKIKKDYGKENMALFVHGAPAKHFEYLFKAFGNENHSEPAYAQCAGPREAGFFATFGSGVGSPEPADMQNSKCIIFIGNHIGENMHNSFVQEVSTAIDNGASIIVVDPRLSTIAAKATHWLPIKPGTDIALLLAWMHVLIYDELYDKKYIDKYAFGFDQLKEHVRNYTPEWAAGITTIDPELIRKSAYEMAAAAPAAVIHPGRHTTWYGDDTQRERAMAIINALLGAYGRRGGMYMGVRKKLPKYPVPEFPEPHWSWKDITKDKYKNAAVGITNVLIDASLPSFPKEHQIKGWFIAGTSFINTIPDRKKMFEAMDNQELIVVVDTMPMEMTGWADVVLPECTYLERHDYARAGKNRVAQIALRVPAVEPKYDSKPAWWIAKQLGHKLGLDKYYPWKDLEEVLDWQFRQIGSSLEEMKKIGVKTIDTGESIYLFPDEDFEFNTNTGKIELYSTDFAEKGYDPLPKYTRHEDPAPGFYHLVYGRAPMHTFGRTQNNPYLYDLRETNNVWINPRTAKLWGIENGTEIWLQNQDGVVSEFPAKARLTERIRPDSVYVVHGFGHTDTRLSRAHGRGINDVPLITKVKIDPVMGGTGMRNNFVTFLLEKPEKETKKEEVKS